jgi:flagellin
MFNRLRHRIGGPEDRGDSAGKSAMSFSINTNNSAMVALQSLTDTTADLQATQKRVATGYRVADAKDDGAAYAVAERIRGDVAATQSANQQLGSAQGLLSVTATAMQNVSDQLTQLQSVTVKLADGTLTTAQRSQYQAQVKQLTNAMNSFIKDATYNGMNILNDPATTLVNVVQDGSGAYYTFNGYKAVTNIYNVVSGANAWTAGDAVAALTKTGALTTTIDNTLTQMNQFGSYTNYVSAQVTYNNNVMDAQNTGLGALVDADMAKESAKLQAMQIRQQLGTQALSIANSAPQVLLSLFR